MGTEELRAAVLRQAAEEAAALVDAATTKASQAVENEKRRLEELAEKRAAEYRAVRDRDVVNRAAALKIELRNALLKRKQELLDELYAEMENRVRNDEGLYHSYLKQAVASLGQGTPVSLDCRARDEVVLKDLLNQHAEWTDVRIDPVLADSEAGFVAHFAEGDLDLTLTAATGAVRESAVVDVAQALFGESR
ncbi:MAG: V-type ATP synthase subunit E [Candidatus Cryosericum sp.]